MVFNPGRAFIGFHQKAPRGQRRSLFLALAIASAASITGASSPAFAAATTYSWNTFGSTTADWATAADWTASGGTTNSVGYPGGDPAFVDDIANISYTGNPVGSGTGAVGVNTINLTTPLASTIGALTIAIQDSTATDGITFNQNVSLNVTGALNLKGGTGTGVLKQGKAIYNVASGATLSVGGTVTISSADSVGSATMIINGNTSLGGLTLSNDGDNANITSTAGNVSLGAVSLLRSANPGSLAGAGLHITGGTVTAASFLVGSGNSSAGASITTGSLTVSGAFIVGNNNATSTRVSGFFQTGGIVTASSGLNIASSGSTTANVLQGTAGTYTLSGGTLNTAAITMGAGLAVNVGKFVLSNGATAYIGSGGISNGPGTGNVTSTGSIIAASGSWATSSNSNYSLSSGTTTFQAANAANAPFDMSISGPIAGGGILAKTGGGSLTLSGTNTYSGGTVISAGALYVNNASGSGTGTGGVTVSGGTLGGRGVISGAVEVQSGGHLAPGVNNVGTLTIGSLTADAGSIFDFDVNAGANSFANITGTLTINGGGIDLFQEGTTNAVTTNGNYTLFSVASVPGNFNTLSFLNQPSGVTYTLGSTASTIFVTVSGGTSATGWAVNASGSWGTSGNWLGGVIPGAGSIATFGTVITAPRTVFLDGDRTVTGVSFNDPNSYTLASGSGGNLTLDNGSGNATIISVSGSHSITAPIVLNSPTAVTVTNAADTVTLANTISGNGSLSLLGPGTVALSGNNTYSGGTNIAGGTAQLTGGSPLATGNITNSSAIVVNSASTVTIAGNLSGAGTLNQVGTGTLILSGNNTYTGVTTLNAGTHVQLGSSTAMGTGNINFLGNAFIDLNGNSLTVGSLTGSGTFDNLLALSNSSLSFTTTAATTFSSNLLSTNGSLAFIKNGAGNLTMGGTTTYTGGTTINGGAILITSANSVGTGPITVATTMGIIISDGVTLTNNIVNAIASAEFVDVSAANANVTLAGNITSTSGSQYRLGVSGTGATLTLTGASSAQAISVVTQGNIVFAGNATLTVTENLPSASTALLLGRTAGKTLNLTIQDNAAIVANNGVSLGSANSADAATINVTLNGNGSLNSGALLPFNVADSNVSAAKETVSLNDNSSLKVSGFASSKSGNTATLNFNGGTVVALAADGASAFFPAFTNVTANVQAGGLKVNDGGFAVTIAQPLLNGTSGGADGGLIKSGTGTLALNGVNTYTGNTVVNAGTLAGTGSIAGAVIGGPGAHTINPGAAAAGSVGTLTVASLTTSANTTLAFDLTTPAGTNDVLAVTGNVNLTAGGKLAISSQTGTGNTSLGYYKVLTYGTLTGSTSGIVLPAVGANNIAYTLDTTHDVGTIDIHRGYVGDATDDGVVDLNDLNVVLNNLGVTTSSWNLGNFDGAATIDLNDLNAVLNHLGTSIPAGANIVAFAQELADAGTLSPAATPEPASLGILALGAAALISRRRKA